MNIHTKLDSQRRDIALEITTKILTELERGVMPWRKPWDGARTGLALPRRATGENYRGVNIIMLWSAAVAKCYESPYWLTLRQANQLGAHVRKGERGELVVHYGVQARRILARVLLAGVRPFCVLCGWVSWCPKREERLGA